MKICEIISVGTELLLGEILNTNAQYLCRQLAAMGISVRRVATVGDNPARLTEDFLAAWARSDIVILTGGLGPTKDDITKEIICEALGEELIEDPKQMKAIADFFKSRKLPCGHTNQKQALVPQNGTVLYNENGTAPGCVLQRNGKLAALLPGPPREMQPMFTQTLQPLLAPYASGVIISHHVNCIGLGESRMAELAGELLDNENPTVAPYAKDGESYLRVSAFAETQEEAEKLCHPFIEKLQNILGDFVYAIDQSLEETLLALLKAQGKTIAFAESCTGGGIAAAFTDVPGASAVFTHGFVTYANRAKEELLHVSPETIFQYGAVSEQCAREMAEGARKRANADIAIAVTGVAGPSQSEAKPAGLIYIAAANGTRTITQKLETGRNSRDYNRTAARKNALALARQLLINNE